MHIVVVLIIIFPQKKQPQGCFNSCLLSFDFRLFLAFFYEVASSQIHPLSAPEALSFQNRLQNYKKKMIYANKK